MKASQTSVFHEKDYRNALKQRQNQLKNTLGKSYSMAELASTIRVQRTYLSKVFAGDADLSDDQIYLALKYLKFSERETEYLRLLHGFQRSGLAERKQDLENQLLELRQESMRADRHMATKLVSDTQDSTIKHQKYFLDPMVQLSHMFLTIDRYRKNHRDLMSDLHLTETRWNAILDTLIDLKLVTVEQNAIAVTQEHIMLSKDSPLASAYHMAVKANASSRLLTLPPNQKNSFSIVFTCSQETSESIRLRMIEFLKALEQLARDDEKTSDVFQLSIDLFPWT